MQPSEAVNLFDFEKVANQKLARLARDYYASGAHDEITLRANCDAFRRISLRPRVLVDVSQRSCASSVMGHDVRMPILVAPTAFHGMAHPDGELATAQAAGEAGSIMMLSTLSNTAVEQVVAATTAAVFFQLYVYRDRGVTKALIERAEAAGCKALVLTVDAPVLGTRERDVRNRFHLPSGLRVENLLPAGKSELPPGVAESGLAAYFAELIDPSLCFADLEWLASCSKLPLVVKGVARGDDARRAVDHGAAGVVVSNHGGRQLDTAAATIDMLPDVAAAVGDDAVVLLDGGIRRGTDVLKAIALGARAVLVGRPVLWGLACAGAAGVSRVLELLHHEFDLAMALCGCPRVSDISRDLIQ